MYCLRYTSHSICVCTFIFDYDHMFFRQFRHAVWKDRVPSGTKTDMLCNGGVSYTLPVAVFKEIKWWDCHTTTTPTTTSIAVEDIQNTSIFIGCKKYPKVTENNDIFVCYCCACLCECVSAMCSVCLCVCMCLLMTVVGGRNNTLQAQGASKAQGQVNRALINGTAEIWISSQVNTKTTITMGFL